MTLWGATVDGRSNTSRPNLGQVSFFVLVEPDSVLLIGALGLRRRSLNLSRGSAVLLLVLFDLIFSTD